MFMSSKIRSMVYINSHASPLQVLSVAGRYIYLLGGCFSTDKIATQAATWRYDGARGLWSPCAPMLQARSDFAAVSIGSRFILVAGESE